MTKNQLIKNIHTAFKNVKLEDGIGLWEAQGLDNRLTEKECEKLREKDEKKDWHNIPVLDLYKCSSSLSFFDAKGMRFHLPQLMLFYLDVSEEEELALDKKGKLKGYACPDIVFDLSYKVETPSQLKRFSALNIAQIQCVLHFLEYLLEGENTAELRKTIAVWKAIKQKKLN